MSDDGWRAEQDRQAFVDAQRRSQEAAQQVFNSQERTRDQNEQRLWWQRFYAGMDQQRDQMERAGRDWRQEFERLEHHRHLDDARRAEQQASPSWEAAVPAVESSRLAEYVSAFHGTFAEHPMVEALWREAAAGAHDFAEARRHFWESVNHGDSEAADFVKGMLTAAGYEVQTGSRAPVRDLPDYEVGPANEGRRNADLLLSIDHMDPIRNPTTGERLTRDEALDPANLRFMSARDNATRRNDYGPDDRPWAT